MTDLADARGSTGLAVVVVGLAAVAVVAIPFIVSTLGDRSTGTFMQVGLLTLALYPGTVAWLARQATRPGFVLLTGVVPPIPIMVLLAGGLGGVVVGGVASVGLALAIAIAAVGSRRGGRPGIALGYVLGAVGVVLYLVGPARFVLPGF